MFVDSFLRCIWIHTDTLFTNFDRCDLKSAKASRKLRERSAKALTSWDGPPHLIWEWQCPLRSGACGVWLCPLRSAVAVGARQCPLKSGARGWGPAVPTEIWSSHLRVGWRTRRWRRRRPPDAISIHMLPHVATVITAAKRCPLCLELKVSTRTSLRKTGNLCHMFSAKARESEFQTHGCRERKTLHRERFAKEMAKGKIE